MNPQHSAVLLDLDGTLIDSQHGILASCHAALVALGHRPDAAFDISAIIGPPMDQTMQALLARYGDDRVAAGVAAYREHYGTVGLFDCTVYPGIAEALDTLTGDGCTLYVATSKQVGFARRIVERLGLVGRLSGVYGADPALGVGEKAELIAHVLEREGLRSERCVMVGDRRFDVIGARANGVRSLGVLWGFGSRDELETAGADGLVERPVDLPGAIAALLGAASARG